MSEENVELIRGLVAESNMTGEVGLRAAHPDIGWLLYSNHLDQRVLRGCDEVAEYVTHWRGAFDGVRVDAHDYIDGGHPVVLPLAFRRQRGDFSSVEWTHPEISACLSKGSRRALGRECPR